jgi:hypothetical protein
MKFEPGDLIEEVVDGQADARCIVVKLKNHPVVPGLTDYTLYLVWAAPQDYPRHSPGETLILTNVVVESSDDDYYWRKA